MYTSMSSLSFVTLKMVAMLMLSLALLNFFFFREKMLLSLLSLEFVVLSMFMCLLITLSELSQPISISFYLLILSACETSLGLSLLVMMSRFKGSDMLSLISLFKF